MNKLFSAVALAIVVPGVAHAQAAPAEKPKMDCCEKMQDKGSCCDKMAGKMQDGGGKPSADPHAGHSMTPSPAPAGGHAHN